MAKKTAIVTFGYKRSSTASGNIIYTDSTHVLSAVLQTDDWIEVTIYALRADVFISPANMKLVSWVDTDADDLTVKGKLKWRIPKEETRTFWFTASRFTGGYYTTFLVTAPKAANALKTTMTIGVV